MIIGYACMLKDKPDWKFSTIRVKNYDQLRYKNIVESNLDILEKMINYNIEHGIKMFRLSSDIIPLASHIINTFDWAVSFKQRLEEIGSLIKNSGIRVSMHPGQYTVINSNNEEVVKKSIEDLEYHCKFLDLLKVDSTCKIILHIGGVYGEKDKAIKRFISVYNTLSANVRERLVIENDDKSYTLEDVLLISEKCDIPVVFDNLHHELNPSLNNLSVKECIEKARNTWKKKDGMQKIHYSQPQNNGNKYAHSKTIKSDVFYDFVKINVPSSTDIMLEVKDKNLSAIKCSSLFDSNIKISFLEKQWAYYKYLVMMKSPKQYGIIRDYLKNKDTVDVKTFYRLIDEALFLESSKGNVINTSSHMWGYVKRICTKAEKNKYKKLESAFKIDQISEKIIFNFLFKLANKYHIEYLQHSLIFFYY